MSALVTTASHDDGAIWTVTFGAAKGNILDHATLADLTVVFRRARESASLKAICLRGRSPDFSFGASIEEHLPGRVETMLGDMRTLTFALLESRVVVVAAIEGRCLGGGLELASLCHRLVAASGASFGQPEITLGVFAPIASIVLPERIGRPRAEDLCLTGRIIDAAEAEAIGLVDEQADGDVGEAAVNWARRHILRGPPASLRLAVGALRGGLERKLREDLPAIERLYLEELMATPGAVEGLRAFLEKRSPRF